MHVSEGGEIFVHALTQLKICKTWTQHLLIVHFRQFYMHKNVSVCKVCSHGWLCLILSYMIGFDWLHEISLI